MYDRSIHTMVYMQRSEDNTWGVSSLLPPSEPLDETQVVGFGSKNFTS